MEPVNDPLNPLPKSIRHAAAAALKCQKFNEDCGLGGKVVDEPRPLVRRRGTPIPPTETLAEFIGGYKPLNYLLKPIIDAGGLYTLTGKTGSAKTAFLCLLSLAIAFERRDLFPNDIEPGRVAYLTCENPRNLRMRLMVALDKLGIDRSGINGQFMVQQHFIHPDEMVASLKEAQKDGPFRFIAIDTLASFFDGDNSNDNSQVMKFLRGLRPLTGLEGNPTVVIAAHPIKSATDEQLVPYGGGAILNEVDGNLTMTKITERRSRLHWQGKIRGIEFEPLELEVNDITSETVIDADGALIPMPFMNVCDPTNAGDAAIEEGERTINVLAEISQNESATQRDIGLKFKIPTSTLGRIFKTLLDKKMIEKNIRFGYRLTKKGRSELSFEGRAEEAF